MVRAKVNNGRIEVLDPIPQGWEGLSVKIELAATPDDPIPNLEELLAEFHALGPIEYEPGEQEAIEKSLKEMDDLGRAEMEAIAGIKR